MAGAAPLPMRRELFQDLSLTDQPRDRSRPLETILQDEGVSAGVRVGVAGWKSYARRDWLETPAYLVDTLRELVGPSGAVENANDLFIDPATGLRTVNEVEQLIAFEYAACHTSEGVKHLLRGSEARADRAAGRAAPRLERDAAVVPPHAHRGSARAPRPPEPRRSARSSGATPSRPRSESGGRSRVARASSWPTRRSSRTASGDYVERLVAPYFEAIAEWYSAIRVGQTGGTLQAIIDRRLGDPFFGIFLNPGHLLHLDEWVASPVGPGSEIGLRSGSAMQVDVIPATGTPWFTSNIEDGIAIADEALRGELAERDPALWRRVQARRAFMRDALGIELHEDVLPLSNIPAWLPPFLLDTGRAMTVRPA